MHHPTDRIAHTTRFVTLGVEHWLEREITFINPSYKYNLEVRITLFIYRRNKRIFIKYYIGVSWDTFRTKQAILIKLVIKRRPIW